MKYKAGMHPNSRKALKPIPKGTVLNPEGGRAHNPFDKMLRRFTNEFLKEVIELAVMGNLAGLKAIVDDPNSEAIKVGVAKSLFNAISKGDWITLERIIERIVGKVAHKIETSGVDGGPQIIVTIPSNGREVKIDK